MYISLKSQDKLKVKPFFSFVSTVVFPPAVSVLEQIHLWLVSMTFTVHFGNLALIKSIIKVKELGNYYSTL